MNEENQEKWKLDEYGDMCKSCGSIAKDDLFLNNIRQKLLLHQE